MCNGRPSIRLPASIRALLSIRELPQPPTNPSDEPRPHLKHDGTMQSCLRQRLTVPWKTPCHAHRLQEEAMPSASPFRQRSTHELLQLGPCNSAGYQHLQQLTAGYRCHQHCPVLTPRARWQFLRRQRWRPHWRQTLFCILHCGGNSAAANITDSVTCTSERYIYYLSF